MKKLKLLLAASGLGLFCTGGAIGKIATAFVPIPKSNIEYLGGTRIALGIINDSVCDVKFFIQIWNIMAKLDDMSMKCLPFIHHKIELFAQEVEMIVLNLKSIIVQEKIFILY